MDTSRITTKRIVWTRVDAEGSERCLVEFTASGARVIGEVDAGETCRYALSTSAEDVFERVVIDARGRELAVEFDGSDWRVDGEVRSDLASAREVDIAATPATNALPIRRLRLAEGESADIDVAYIRVPELDVRIDAQRYTRIDGRTYLYESRDSDFRRTLTVDDDGFVLSYPGLFERVTGS